MLKIVAQRIGQLITVAALIFLVLALYQQWGAIVDWQPTVLQIALFAVLSLIYSAALVLLAFNWATIVQTLIAQPPSTILLLLSYTKTQIAKYVPGNVVHLISRHMYLKQLGLDHRPLATGSFLELVSLPLAAGIAICLASTVIGDASIGPWEMGAFAPFFLFGVVGISGLVIWRTQRSWHFPAIIVLCRGMGFMLCQGGIFAVVLYVVSGSFVAFAIPAAILAWLVGFLTPGAPGGIAVREVLLINLLTQVATGDDILIAALIFRIITTAGDLALYVFGNVILEKYLPEYRGSL